MVSKNNSPDLVSMEHPIVTS